MESRWYEVAELAQGFCMLVMESHHGLEWYGEADVRTSGRATRWLRTWRPCHKVDIRTPMRWQHVEERHRGAMDACFLKSIVQGMLRSLRTIAWDKDMGEGHDHSSFTTGMVPGVRLCLPRFPRAQVVITSP